MKILIVDDDQHILTLLTSFLSARGRDVISAANGQEALQRLAEGEPDLVLLDVMMPGLDGWQVLSRIREISEVPVIMLTAKDTPTDTIQGLYSGADDYVAKPFDFAVLEARIAALLRRSDKKKSPASIHAGDLTINDVTKEITYRDQTIRLSPKEYDLLKLLASEPGKVFSHKEIIEEVWQGKYLVSSKDVIKCVELLRRKVEKDPKNPQLIVNIRGFGYTLSL